MRLNMLKPNQMNRVKEKELTVSQLLKEGAAFN